MSIPEFEAILDKATRNNKDSKKLFAEVYFLNEKFNEAGQIKTLQALISVAKEFERMRIHEEAQKDMGGGTSFKTVSNPDTSLSREQRRALQRNKSGTSAPKKKKKRKKK